MPYSRFSERSTVTSCSTQEYIWVNLTVKRILGHSTIACFKICDTLVRYGDIASRRGGGDGGANGANGANGASPSYFLLLALLYFVNLISLFP